LVNLLDNALRHSEQHCGIRWARILTGADPGSGRPWLEVQDRGAGITAVQRERLFEPFFTTSHNGTGLGLYISRELCEMNHATLEYREESSAQGEETTGARFRIGFAHPDRHIEPNRK
jgi:two-component system sensor histidine kinase PilS (NtrC family)